MALQVTNGILFTIWGCYGEMAAAYDVCILDGDYALSACIDDGEFLKAPLSLQEFEELSQTRSWVRAEEIMEANQ